MGLATSSGRKKDGDAWKSDREQSRRRGRKTAL